MDNQGLLAEMARIARLAGEAILEVYQRADLGVQTKADDSPLTAADLAAHKIIVSELQKAAPEIPVLSEESDALPYAERRSWSRYFLVDPLDGTKEFVNRNGEFTVNIALIEANQPVLGAVFVPVQDKMYLGDVTARSALRQDAQGEQAIKARPNQGSELTVVASRRHGAEALQTLMTRLQQDFTVTTENYGSSLKFCMIAEGRADLYPRFAPTSEWDTGAAQAVVEAAGGRVVDLQFQPLRYNAKADILNPEFLVLADPDFDWQRYLQ
ncbi:MAG: 3'(2'),5'-bisphosphate nucleotidase CysQ [Pseudomonadales bacterium]